MPLATTYVYGQPLTPDEFVQARQRILPDWSRRFQRMPPAVMLAALHASAPDRLEFEINRARGLAFDSGEGGFSHTFIEGGTP